MTTEPTDEQRDRANAILAENNQKIAIFLGGEHQLREWLIMDKNHPVSGVVYWEDANRQFIVPSYLVKNGYTVTDDSGRFGEFVPSPQLQFHSSWEWLMYGWFKFQKDYEISCQAGELGQAPHILNSSFWGQFRDGITNENILLSYSGLVKGIEFLNHYRNNPE